jgi:hypothetical protein
MLVALTCTGRSWSFSRIGLGNSPRSRRFSITPLRLRPTRARRRSAGFSWNPPAVRIFIVVFRIERFGQHQSQSSGKHPTARGHIFARRGGGATVPVVLAKKPLPDRRWLDRSRKGSVRARRVGTRVSSRKPQLFQLQPANASRPGEIAMPLFCHECRLAKRHLYGRCESLATKRAEPCRRCVRQPRRPTCEGRTAVADKDLGV